MNYQSLTNMESSLSIFHLLAGHDSRKQPIGNPADGVPWRRGPRELAATKARLLGRSRSWLCGLLVAPVLLLAPSAGAASITGLSNPNLAIPDNDVTGVANNITLNTAINFITGVTVTLDVEGGFNGDFYAYLRHGSTGFAVLLNRVGSTSGNAYGYADAGLNVSFSDTAANGDIHVYQNVLNPGGAMLTGLWQPDGRNVSPFSALDTSPRNALLSSFDGMDANGLWTLFVSDVSPVGSGTLVDWSVTVTGDTVTSGVPDGGSTAALLAAALAGLLTIRRKVCS
jgi:subtilisin-like proprotein convertase family protein